MKKISLFILLALNFQLQSFIFSQSCLPDGIIIKNQAAIDNFQTNFPGCKEIEGYLKIYGDNINNLQGLSVLNAIGGDLWVGSYDFGGNPELTDLDGLENLDTIGGYLAFGNNDNLTSLSGLENLNYVGGGLTITWNESLYDISSLANLTSIGGSIGGGLWVSYNALADLIGLHNITSIGGSLNIVGNELMKNLNELSNLTSIDGDLSISYNDSLSNIEGIANIDATFISNLKISSNPQLSTCEVESICSYLSDPNGYIIIGGNNTGCESEEEVKEACMVSAPLLPFGVSPISFYPNPAKNDLYISSRSLLNFQVHIFNQFGQEVLSINHFNKNIDVSILNSGIYIIEIITNQQRIREKLIIKR